VETITNDREKDTAPKSAGAARSVVGVGLGLALGALAGVGAGLVVGIGIPLILDILWGYPGVKDRAFIVPRKENARGNHGERQAVRRGR
jgi:hypothetical protein